MCPADAATAKSPMALADRLMYVGKKSGRDRVVTVNELDGEVRASDRKRN